MRRSALLLLVLLTCTPAAHAQTYYANPGGLGPQAGVVAGAGGAVWFAAGSSVSGGAPSLVRLDPAAATPGTSNGMQVFPTPTVDTPCCARSMRALDFDPAKGRVWFARGDRVVGYGAPATMSPGTSNGMRVLVSSDDALRFEAGGLAVDQNGAAWVSEISAGNAQYKPAWAGNRIAKVTPPATDPAGGFTTGMQIDEGPNIAFQSGSYDSSRFDAKPRGVTIGPDNTPWFAESSGGNPGYRIANYKGGSTYTEFQLSPCPGTSPCSGSHSAQGPLDVTADHQGGIWFTNPNERKIGVLKNGTFTSYALSAMDSVLVAGEPLSASTAPDGTVWFTVVNGGTAHRAIVKIDPATSSSTVFRLGSGYNPIDVAADAAGNVWFTATLMSNSSMGRLGRLSGVTGTGSPPDDKDDDDDGADPGTGTGGGGPGPGPGGDGGAVTGPPAPGTPTRTPITNALVPVTAAAAVPTDPSVRGATMTLNQRCVGPPEAPCSLIYLIETREYVAGHPGVQPFQKGRKKARRTRIVRVGTKSVTLRGGQTQTVKITLNAKGKRLLTRFKRLPVRLRVQQKLPGGKLKTVKVAKTAFRARR